MGVEQEGKVIKLSRATKPAEKVKQAPAGNQIAQLQRRLGNDGLERLVGGQARPENSDQIAQNSLQAILNRLVVGGTQDEKVNNQTPARTPVVQRKFLDRTDKMTPVSEETAKIRGYTRIKQGVVREVRRCQQAESHSPQEAVAALKQLQTRLTEYQQQLSLQPKREHKWKHFLADERIHHLLSTLQREATQVIDEWELMNEITDHLSDPSYVKNVNNLFGHKLELRKKNYTNWDALNNFRNGLVLSINRLIEHWRQGKSEEEARFGDPVTGKFKEGELEEINRYRADFKKMRAIIENRSKMIELLEPLAQSIEADLPKGHEPTGADFLRVLQAQLGHYEQLVGFRPVTVVPMGILSAETFLGLVGDGHILDDFGAGIVHGEMIHRIQWHALSRAISVDFTSPQSPAGDWQFTALQLYKRMNQPPFSNDRAGSGASRWGQMIDRGVSSTEKHYAFPGTLNRDLLEAGLGGAQGLKGFAGQYMEKEDVNKAWPERGGESSPPENIGNLASIGKGLAHQSEQRFLTARKHGQAYDWTGVHPEKVSQEFEKGLLEQGYESKGGYLEREE